MPSDMAAVGAGLLAVLLLLLFVYRRQSYLLWWIGAWVLTAGGLLLGGRAFGAEPGASLRLGLSQLCLAVAPVLLTMSALSFRRPRRVSPKLMTVVLPLGIWFALAPLALGRPSVLVPGYVLSAASLGLASGVFFLLLRRFRMLGAAFVGSGLAGLAISHLWAAANALSAPGTTEVRLGVVTLNAALYVIMALGMYLFVTDDMTYELRVTNRRLSEAQAELHALAITDELTGCYNRRYFEQMIRRELKRHERYGLPLSLLFIDIDRFKYINDRLGHETGDRVLRLVADLLLSQVRSVDYVFRWGGDEFVVLLSCDRAHARRKAEQIKDECARLTTGLGLLEGVTLSIGCGSADVNLENPHSLIRAADEEMYRDKLQGRALDQA